ncbi:hypothetical protein DQK91_14160 [Oceanidesulfovibrio marinus]|uniref:histidine kinase n=2 Tax=Oceanidesulfovibrio marinus TaxID=370038 RepID=A0A6P1ZH26_9BACT|nr:hypothetical protein DQK91_14160 [Oceanidesulfovibrio marinus]
MDIDGFGKRVRYLRTLARLTQAQMAERLGVTPEHLGNIERGVSVPSFELIYRIADSLGTEPFNLFLSPKKEDVVCLESSGTSWSSFLSGMGSWEYNLETGEMEWSDSLYRLLGYSPKDVTPTIEFLIELVHPDDVTLVRSRWKSLRAGRSIPPARYRIRVRSGEYRIFINYGEVHKRRGVIIVFNVDVTDNCMLIEAFRHLQKVEEEENAGRTRSLQDVISLLASAMDKKGSLQVEMEDHELLFRNFVENIRDIFHVMEPGKGFTYVSPVFEDIVGAPESTILEDLENYYRLVHQEDRERVRALHQRRLRGEEARGVYRIVRPDGSIRRLRSRGFILPNGDGGDGQLRVIGITEDVTDLHCAESAREKAEGLLEKVLTAVGDAVCIVDKERCIVRANEGMEELFTSQRPLVGKRHEELLEQAGVVAGVPRPLEEWGGEVAVLEHRVSGRDTRTLEVHHLALHDDAGAPDGGVIVMRDVTATRRIIKELEQAKTCAERANEEKSRYLAHLSHEIRTPLSSILGVCQLLAMEKCSSDQLEYVEGALASGAILKDLVSGVLDLSRVEAGRMELSEEPFSARDVVERVLMQYRFVADRKGVQLESDFGEALPETLCGDGARIRQVLSNLVGNAMKFTDRGGITVSADTLNGDAPAASALDLDGVDDSAKVLCLVVRDTGQGIPQDKLECIFREFEQAGCKQSCEQGYGLGLAIIKRLLLAMGGDITVQSEPGKGSSFTCLIPVRREE